MIAYDLDGVFVNDIQIIDNLSELLRIRSKNLKPIFVPENDYVVITGRPNIDITDTTSWFNEFFNNKPKEIFHGNNSLETGKEYKLSILKTIRNYYPITLYVESEKEQADFLQYHLKDIIEICHFQTFINKSLSIREMNVLLS